MGAKEPIPPPLDGKKPAPPPPPPRKNSGCYHTLENVKKAREAVDAMRHRKLLEKWDTGTFTNDDLKELSSLGSRSLRCPLCESPGATDPH